MNFKIAAPREEDIRAEIIEEGKAIYAVMSYGTVTIRERVPRHVLKLSDDKQQWILDGVIARSRTRLFQKLIDLGKSDHSIDARVASMRARVAVRRLERAVIAAKPAKESA